MRKQGGLSIISDQQDNTISLMIIKTTTYTWNTKILVEKCEKKSKINHTRLKTLPMVYCESFFSQWELSIVGYWEIISKGTKITEILHFFEIIKTRAIEVIKPIVSIQNRFPD